MKTMLRGVTDGEVKYQALMFVCPGCKELRSGGSGLHMLSVNNSVKNPSWGWNGDHEKPTLTPSILTRYPVGDKMEICHSFLRDGVFQFLGDCTHSLAGQEVEIPDLPDWVTDKE